VKIEGDRGDGRHRQRAEIARRRGADSVEYRLEIGGLSRVVGRQIASVAHEADRVKLLAFGHACEDRAEALRGQHAGPRLVVGIVGELGAAPDRLEDRLDVGAVSPVAHRHPTVADRNTRAAVGRAVHAERSGELFLAGHEAEPSGREFGIGTVHAAKQHARRVVPRVLRDEHDAGAKVTIEYLVARHLHHPPHVGPRGGLLRRSGQVVTEEPEQRVGRDLRAELREIVQLDVKARVGRRDLRAVGGDVGTQRGRYAQHAHRDNGDGEDASATACGGFRDGS